MYNNRKNECYHFKKYCSKQDLSSSFTFQLVVIQLMDTWPDCFCWLDFEQFPDDGLTTYRGWPTSPCLPICINHSLDLTVTRQQRRGDVQPPCRNQDTSPENVRLSCYSDKCIQCYCYCLVWMVSVLVHTCDKCMHKFLLIRGCAPLFHDK